MKNTKPPARREIIKAQLHNPSFSNSEQTLRAAFLSLGRSYGDENPESFADSLLLDLGENLREFIVQYVGITNQADESPEIRAVMLALGALVTIPNDAEMALRAAGWQNRKH